MRNGLYTQLDKARIARFNSRDDTSRVYYEREAMQIKQQLRKVEQKLNSIRQK